MNEKQSQQKAEKKEAREDKRIFNDLVRRASAKGALISVSDPSSKTKTLWQQR